MNNLLHGDTIQGQVPEMPRGFLLPGEGTVSMGNTKARLLQMTQYHTPPVHPHSHLKVW